MWFTREKVESAVKLEEKLRKAIVHLAKEF